MPLTIKTTGLGPTACPKPTPPRRHAPHERTRRPSTSSDTSTATTITENTPEQLTQKQPTNPPYPTSDDDDDLFPAAGFKTLSGLLPGLNTNAWVYINRHSPSICNDRRKFLSYDTFATPLPMHCFFGALGISALGIGEGEVLAWFPHQRRTERGLFVLRQAGVFDRLWFPYHRPEEGGRPALMLTSWPEREPMRCMERIGSEEDLFVALVVAFQTQGPKEVKMAAAQRVVWRTRHACLKPWILGLFTRVWESIEREGAEESGAASGESASGRGDDFKMKRSRKVKRKGKAKAKAKGGSTVPVEQRPVEVIGWSLRDGRMLVKGSKQWSKFRFLKRNWGNRYRFQLHYGLTMSDKDIDEGDELIEQYRQREYFV